jgi:hypothetical protein
MLIWRSIIHGRRDLSVVSGEQGRRLVAGRGEVFVSPLISVQTRIDPGYGWAWTTGLIKLPMPSIVMRTMSPFKRVKSSGGTMPVPVKR